MQNTSKGKTILKKLIFASLCLAFCIVLPFITGHVPKIGNMLCPMHIPVLLCGFICGPWWAMCIGGIAPLLRFVLFGMPPLIPVGAAMVFELMTYGFTAGMMYRLLPKKNGYIYVSLGTAMLLGRIVLGIASVIIYGTTNDMYTWPLFFAEAFVTPIWGIMLQIILIPLIVIALKKSHLTE